MLGADLSSPEKQTKVLELSKAKHTILKIGGSVITDKNGELAARTQVIDRLADEIQKANVKNLMMVHGGGSFGHPTAQQYTIKEGFKNPSQIIGFAQTHHFMTVLNGLVMDSLIMHDVPAVSITASSCIITENGRIKCFEDTTLKIMLDIGVIPVLYGDAVVDSKLGFTILSGDQLASVLAARFNGERIIMGVDVDGLFDADPKAEKNPNLLTHLTLDEAKKLHARLNKSTVQDVTGGMYGKISELLPAVELGTPVFIVNATKPNVIYRVLKGEKVEGTLIEKE
jgi:isopentenyl phosphate kinase